MRVSNVPHNNLPANGERVRWEVAPAGASGDVALVRKLPAPPSGAEDTGIHRRPFRRLAPEFSLQGPNSILALVVSFGTNVPTCRAACSKLFKIQRVRNLFETSYFFKTNSFILKLGIYYLMGYSKNRYRKKCLIK